MKTLLRGYARFFHKSVACFMAFCMVNLPAWALDASDATVAAGGANISSPATNTVSVDLITSRAVLDWTQMNAASSETLNFSHASSFAVLNRVASAVNFNGTLNGVGGRIYVISPNGVLLGPDARISATSFTAAGLNITNDNFMNGVDQFQPFAGGVVGNITNYATIDGVSDQVSLIGKSVINEGVISLPAGGIAVMAAGDSVYLGTPGGKVIVEMSGIENGQVVNNGTINTPNGQIIMAAGDMYSMPLQSGLQENAGKVDGGSGSVSQLGTLNADGIEGDGGRIMLTAGDSVLLADGSATTANAGLNGNGGQIIAYSPGTAEFAVNALVAARGGEFSGNGGFVELSGIEAFLLAGTPDLQAPAGFAGKFLIDPRNVTIRESNPGWNIILTGYIVNYLNNKGSLEIATPLLGFDEGNIKVLDPIAWSSNNSLVLDAHNDIFVNATITNAGSGDLTLDAYRHLFVNADLNTGGNLNLIADSSGKVIGDMISADGVLLTAGRNIVIRGNNVVLGGAVAAGRDLTIVGRDCLPCEGSEWGNVHVKSTLAAGGDIEISVTGVEKEWVWDCWPFKGHYELTYVPGTITLDGDVTAGDDIRLYNNTYTTNVTGNGVTLKAGDDLELINSDHPLENAEFIQGTHHLGLIAGDEIDASSTVIGVTGSSLLMQQEGDLDTADYTFANQGGTDLTLISDEGSVTSTMSNATNAADKWMSIGATAAEDITLEGSGSIKLGDSGNAGLSLWAQNGTIDVQAGYNVSAAKDIKAGTDIQIDAKHGIALQGAQSGGNMTIKADTDKYWGQDVAANGNLASGGSMTLEGGNVELKGNAESEGDMQILAHGLYSADGSAPGDLVAGGDVKVDGSLSSGGEMDVTAVKKTGGPANGPDFNGGSAPYNATGSIFVGENAQADGTMTMNAGQDITVNGRTGSGTAMVMNAGDDIVLKGNVQAGTTMNLTAADDMELNSTRGNTTAGGHLTLLADELDHQGIAGGDITVHGKLESTAGDITARAGDDIFLNNTPLSAKAAGNMTLTADSDNGNGMFDGDLDIAGSLEAGGDITLSASANTIYIGGDHVTATGNVTLNDDTVMDGVGSQRIDAVNGTLLAKQDIDKTKKGNLTLAGGNGIQLGDDVSTSNGNLIFEDAVTAIGGDQTFDAEGDGKKLIAMNDITKSTNGDLTLDGGYNAGYEIELDGDVTVANGDLYIGENGSYVDDVTVAAGKKLESTRGDIRVSRNLNGEGSLTVTAGDDLHVYGNVDAANHLRMKSGQVNGLESEMMIDGDVTAQSIALRAGTGTVDGTRRDTIKIYGDVESTEGSTRIVSDDHIYIDGSITSAANVKLIGNRDHNGGGIVGDVTVTGDVDADNVLVKGRNVHIDGLVTAENNVRINAADRAYNGVDGDVYVGNGIKAGSDIIVKATDDITLGTTGGVSARAGDDIILKADRGGFGYGYGGDVTAYGDLFAGDDIVIDASDNTINLFGNVFAQDTIHLMANTRLQGKGTQILLAGNWLQADGFVRKCTQGDMIIAAMGENEAGQSLNFLYSCDGDAISTYNGNLWIAGLNDIQISGDVSTLGEGCGGKYSDYSFYPRQSGGVLIYSMDGSIYTGDVENGLNVNVTGYSDHMAGRGVFNPFAYMSKSEKSYGYAAIAIVSKEDLKLGPDGSLNAFGIYYDECVDDRSMINFLDMPDVQIPDGGPIRDEGDAFDMAIYVASTEGNVEVDMSTQIKSLAMVPAVQDGFTAKISDYPYGYESKGAMVIDAYDTVKFGPNFEKSLFGDGITSEVGDRLEVVSRISEWLQDAYGRLPYANPAEGSGPFVPGYNYVFRGAGMDNPEITDGRAWVLEALPEPVAPLADMVAPELKGCPALMDAAAAELAVNSDELQLMIGNAMASNPAMQPCDACQQLVNAASTLKDVNGQRMAALSQIFNTLAPADAPFTPEMSASVATAFADLSNEDSQYALASDYVNAFVAYVATLEKDLKLPVGDPTAIVLEKYGQAITNSNNPNIAAYIMAQVNAEGQIAQGEAL